MTITERALIRLSGQLDAYGDPEIREAIRALKKQIPQEVEPSYENISTFDGRNERVFLGWKCPECDSYFTFRNRKYCDQCGQAVFLKEAEK